MKIKIAVLDKDEIFLKRLYTSLGTRYKDKLEMLLFTDETTMLKSMKEDRVDVLLASEDFEIDTKSIPTRTAFAYFVSDKDVVTYLEQPAISKFQKAELIYKDIVNIFSEKTEDTSQYKYSDKDSQIIIFSSPCGGTGTTSVAIACAINFAREGFRTLYLNLESFGAADILLSGEGKYGMSDVIYAIKRKSNLDMKLESCIKQDSKSGIYFISSTGHALDMISMGKEEKIVLIKELSKVDKFDYIIVDMDFGFDKDTFDVYSVADNLVMVNDGSLIANSKVSRMYGALCIKEEEDASLRLIHKLNIIYNKVDNGTGGVLQDINIKELGGIGKYKGSVLQIIRELSKSDIYNGLR